MGTLPCLPTLMWLFSQDLNCLICVFVIVIVHEICMNIVIPKIRSSTVGLPLEIEFPFPNPISIDWFIDLIISSRVTSLLAATNPCITTESLKTNGIANAETYIFFHICIQFSPFI